MWSMPAWALFVCALAVALAFVWFCGWYAGRRLAAFEVPEAKDRASLDDEFRKTTAQIVGTAAVVVVFAYTLTKDNLTFEQVRTQSAASTYSEGIKLLKEKDDPTVRAAGIYLVEKVGASDARYLDPITRTLVAFIKEKDSPPWRPQVEFVGPDVKAAVQVLGRTAPISEHEKDSLTLDSTNLARADFGWLAGFKNRRLQDTDLRAAKFKHADLSGAWLSGSEMNDWAAYGAGWTEDIPGQKDWSWKKYRYAVEFDCADLSGAHLNNTGLGGALFGRANMDSTDLDHADISRADFSEVRNLHKVKFGNACADRDPKFPDGFVCKLGRCSDPNHEPPKICGFEKPQDTGRDQKIANTCRAE